MSYFVFYCWLFVCSCGGLVASVGEERVSLSAMVYLKLCGFCSGDPSSSGLLGWAALFYCGTPWTFHTIILEKNTIQPLV